MPNNAQHIADPVDLTVGMQIRLARKAAGLSQQALAERVGVSFQQVQKYERGANRVSASMLVRIADALGVEIADLFGPVTGRVVVNDRLSVLLATPGALDMLGAYAGLPDDVRMALVDLVRSLQKAGALPPSAGEPQATKASEPT